MPPRDIKLIPGNIYHIYNRGVNKERIFYSDKNYLFFIYKMSQYLIQHGEVIAYCLMPNHFHILARVNDESFVAKSMQPLLVSYVKALHIELNRIGPLFQGRFQANLIEDDKYLLDCLKYILLNPVQAALVKTPMEWQYSSYHDYIHHNNGSFINTSAVLAYFENIPDFQEFIESGCENYQSKFFENEK